MGLGRVLGGALQGYGAGQAEVARNTMLERRAMALENLRSQNSMAEQENRAVLEDELSARDLGRRTEAELVLGEQAGQQAAAKAKADREAAAEKAEADRQHEIKKIIVGGQQDRMTAQAKAEFEAGNVADKVVDDKTGEWVLITKGGGRVPTGMQATEKDRTHNPNSGGFGGLLQPPDEAKAAIDADQVEQSPGGKTMTRDQIRATAQANGFSEETTRRMLERRGYTLKE